LNFWLHMQQKPYAIFYHRFPELVVRPKKDGHPNEFLRNVWGRRFACWEDDETLKKQRFRTPEGLREKPPTKCGSCRLQEAIREFIRDGKLRDTDVIFEIGGADDAKEDMVIRAGSFVNLWGSKPDDDTKNRLRSAGVRLDRAWAESGVAKCNYVLVGV